MPLTIVHWFRRDLRLADNRALSAACAAGKVVPLFVLDDDTPGDFRIGGAQRWWLHHSLTALSESLGGKLLLRRGKAADVVRAVAAEVGSSEVHANRLYEPWEAASEAALDDLVTFHDSDAIVPPERIATAAGTSFKVYGAFWRGLAEQLPPDEPGDVPAAIDLAPLPMSDDLASWKLLPTHPDWATGFGTEWTPGEAGAAERLTDFAAEVAHYSARRDLPSEEGTSRLSPHLHWGEVSPRQVWRALHLRGGAKFLKELAWRDFARSAIRAQPDLGTRNGRAAFDRLTWRDAPADLAAWQQGRTGFPIVDAGMRQLWASGWMHNRVRMIVASFLVKHLLIDWRAGAMWFWDTLVDADYGNNSLNWQWVAGTGTASQPFFRIMAPLVQSEKFAAADYIRLWVPELAHLSDAAIHDPADDVRGAYPLKLIGHREARERALAAFKAG